MPCWFVISFLHDVHVDFSIICGVFDYYLKTLRKVDFCKEEKIYKYLILFIVKMSFLVKKGGRSISASLINKVRYKEKDLLSKERAIASREYSVLRKEKDLKFFDKHKADFLALKKEAENVRKDIEKNSSFINSLHSKRVDLLHFEKSLDAKERSLKTKEAQLFLKERALLKREIEWISHKSVLNKLHEDLSVLKEQLSSEVNLVKKSTSVLTKDINDNFFLIKSLKEEIVSEKKALSSLVQKDIKLLFNKEKEIIRINKDIDRKLARINSVPEASYKKHHFAPQEESRNVSLPDHSHFTDPSHEVNAIRSLIDDAKKKGDFDSFEALKSLSLADSLVSKIDDEDLQRELSYSVKEARTTVKLGLLK